MSSKKSITSRSKSHYINNSIFDTFQKIWTYYRWELFVVVSILVLIVCYFFTHQDEYKGLQYDSTQVKKRKRVPKKYETECRRIVESIFNTPFSSIRPSFLKNPKTGKNLELDMYSPHLKLAIEYQGVQHRRYTPFFHRAYSDYLDQVERDTYKKKRCEEEGIDLICVPDTIKYENLREYITKELKRLKKIS